MPFYRLYRCNNDHQSDQFQSGATNNEQNKNSTSNQEFTEFSDNQLSKF